MFVSDPTSALPSSPLGFCWVSRLVTSGNASSGTRLGACWWWSSPSVVSFSVFQTVAFMSGYVHRHGQFEHFHWIAKPVVPVDTTFTRNESPHPGAVGKFVNYSKKLGLWLHFQCPTGTRKCWTSRHGVQAIIIENEATGASREKAMAPHILCLCPEESYKWLISKWSTGGNQQLFFMFLEMLAQFQAGF